MRGKSKLALLMGAGAVFSLALALAVFAGAGRPGPLPPAPVAYGAALADPAAVADAPVAAPGQFDIPPPVMTELADGVWRYFGFFSSSLVVIGGDQVLITDPSNPFLAASLKEEIAKITDSPVTTIVLTHEHYDHAGGTGVFPDATVICHRNCVPIFALASLGDVPEVDVTYDEMLEVVVGDTTVELHYLGPGDGDATTIVYLPAEKILATADLYKPSELTSKNWVDDKHFVGTRHILNTISEWEITHAITAHSPDTDPAGLMENVQYYNDLYDAVYEAISSANAEGGIFAVFGLLDTLPQTLELPQYQDWEEYDTSFPRHVERMLVSIYHGD